KPHLKTLFTLRPFTRLISWGRDFKSVVEYLILNQMEARGLISRPKRKLQRNQGEDKPTGEPPMRSPKPEHRRPVSLAAHEPAPDQRFFFRNPMA
ncbi:MAG: hypothetical protein ACAH59_06800, partial [Pseudobdellovibrionaceae bacterium]